MLGDWSFWKEKPPPSIPRKILEGVNSWEPDLIWVIQGVRRGGKSTLMSQWMGKLKLPPRNCFFMNFEDPRISEFLSHELLDALVSVAELKVAAHEKIYFFFDEIQNVIHWEKWLHKQVERPGRRHFVITGSNASLLANDVATVLTGRHRTLELFPFDYSEFRVARPGEDVEAFLSRGGFPRSLSIEKPDDLLREYYTDILERDVRRHVAAKNPQALYLIAKALFKSTSSETSLRKIAALLDSTIEYVQAGIEACKAAYLVLGCPYFTYSERKRAVRPVKYYPIDTGLHRTVCVPAGGNRGTYLETAVFLHLRRKHRQVFYWRGKGEVDFVVEDRGKLTPIQVSWDGPKARHQEALKEFRKEFPNAAAEIYIDRANIETFLSS